MKRTRTLVMLVGLSLLATTALQLANLAGRGAYPLHLSKPTGMAVPVADGNPAPPFPPPKPQLCADGNPAPPFPPCPLPKSSARLLAPTSRPELAPWVLADGNPAPPFPPTPNGPSSPNFAASSPALTADGNPAPPFPPKPTTQSKPMAA
jgi:hypothetical protein